VTQMNDPKEILWLVEDSQLDAERFFGLLRDQHIEWFQDAESVVERVATGDAPDLVIIDRQLPGMSGLELVRFLRGKHDALELPILIVSVIDGDDEIVAGLRAGANDYVTKPYHSPELAARVDTMIQLRRMKRGFDDALVDRSAALEQARHLTDELSRRLALEKHILGIVSHDLRTPLAVLQLKLGIFDKQEALSQGGKEGVQRMRRAVHRARKIVDDLTDITEAREHGALNVVRTPVDLAATLEPGARDAMATHPDRPLVVRATGDTNGAFDVDRVLQAITNLLNNAVAYGRPGTAITLHIDGSAPDYVTIGVHNEGDAIPESVLPSLFRPMLRNVAPVGPSEPVTKNLGLGLFIVEMIAKAHGGRVVVRSQPESGTEVALLLPRHG
jgi:signal transduction histidine kinase